MTTPLSPGRNSKKRAKCAHLFDLHQKYFPLMATRKATMPPLKPIRNEAEYRAGSAITLLWQQSRYSKPREQHHKALAALVEQYEAAHYPINTHKKHQPQSWCDMFKISRFLNIFPRYVYGVYITPHHGMKLCIACIILHKMKAPSRAHARGAFLRLALAFTCADG